MNKIYYFTGTGNSLHIAKLMSKELDMELINIADVIDEENLEFSGEKIGVVFPVYAMGIPHLVGKFLTKLNIIGDPYIFAIGTCGGAGYGVPFNLIDSILKDKRDTKKKKEKKIELAYASYLQMPDNYLKLFKMKSKEVAKEMIDVAVTRTISKIQDIKNEKHQKPIGLLLNPVFKFIYMFWLSNLKKADKNFRVKDSCVSCNLCSEICPSKNIIMKHGKPTWQGKCQDCMGCINLCPVSAIEIGKKTETKGRYINTYISPEELKLKK